MTRLLGLILIALSLSACSKKEESGPGGGASPAMMAAAPAAAESAKMADRAEQRFLAYEHRVSLEVDAPQLKRLYRELQDACVNEATWHCTVMDASIQLERDQRGGTAHLNLRASPEGVRATLPSRTALLMSRSATRRSSLALASVVSIRSCVIRLAARLRSIARRLDVSRPNCLPAFLCRIFVALYKDF